MKPAGLTIDLPDEAATRRAGEALGTVIDAGAAIALIGELGAGKTTLVQAVAAGVGVPAAVPVTSPTFTLINEYRGGRVALIHADLYRIERDRELDEIGLDELIDAGDAAVLVEWADRFAQRLGADHLRIELSHAGDGRRLVASATGPRSEELLQAWASLWDDPS